MKLERFIGLGRLWWGQAVFDAQFGAEEVELVLSGWCLCA